MANDLISWFEIERTLHLCNITSRHNPAVQKTMNLDIWEIHMTIGKKPSFFNKLIKKKKNTLLNIIITPLANYDPNRELYSSSEKIYPLLYSTQPQRYPFDVNTNQKIDPDEKDKLDEYFPMCFIDDINKNEITKLESEICLTKETKIHIPIGFSTPLGFFFITPTLKPYFTKDDIPHLDGVTSSQFYILFNDGDKLKGNRIIEIDKYLDKFDVNPIAKFL